jgi:hypothetical protein
MGLVALVLMLLAVGLVIVCRPLVELVTLSDQYAAATDAAEQMRILAAGEVLRIQYDDFCTCEVITVDSASGKLSQSLRRLRHRAGRSAPRLSLPPFGDDRLHYTDEIEIQAGLLAGVVWAFAHVFYRHRQRRWRTLLRSKS